MTPTSTPLARLMVSALVLAPALIVAGALSASAKEELIPISYDAVNDRNGFRWDITKQGYINSGTSYTFTRAMVLSIDNAQINPQSAQMTKDKKTYVFKGRSARGSAFERRVTYDLQKGTARFVDTFKNSGRTPLDLRIKLYTRLARSCDTVHSSSGRRVTTGSLKGEEDGIVAFFRSRKPSVAWTIASPRATLRPSLKQSGRRTFEFEFQIRIPPRSERSLVSTLGQIKLDKEPTKRELEDGFATLTSQDYVSDLPAKLRRNLLNFEDVGAGPSESLLGGVQDFVDKHEVDREKHDTVLIGERESMVGTLSGGPVVIKTTFGAIQVDLDEVLLWRGGGRVGHPQLVAVASGEVFRGDATCEGLSLGTKAGVKLPLAPEGFLGIVRRQEKPLAEPNGVFVETHGGTRLLLKEPRGSLKGLTPWGNLTCDLSEVVELQYGGKGYAGLTVTLKDGTRLPIVPLESSFSLESVRLGAIEIPTYRLKRFKRLSARTPTLSKKKTVKVTHAKLAGGAILVGSLDVESLKLVTKTGTSSIARDQIRSITQISEEDSRELRFRVLLWSKEKLEGRLALGRLPIQTLRTRREVPTADLVSFHQAPEPRPKAPKTPGAPDTPPGDF
ncbi:MAG: hypothetical protein JKY65_33815 [Planctomycetes bacterium]|nr:hypothetical protein [Planctomycetota bacterium]